MTARRVWPGSREGPSFEATAVSFELGSIANTTDFYFLLSNSGDQPIHDIILSSSNAAFEVSPAAIDLLAPGADASLLPVIRVTAVHGTASSGIGYAALLSPGSNSTVLQIAGQTTTPVQLSATLNVTALVMAVNAFGAAGEIDLASPTGACFGCVQNYLARTYNVPAGEVRIQNTGNVAIIVTDAGSQTNLANPRTLNAGETLTVATLSGTPPQQQCVGLDGGGTVRDPVRLLTESDGRTYLCFTLVT